MKAPNFEDLLNQPLPLACHRCDELVEVSVRSAATHPPCPNCGQPFYFEKSRARLRVRVAEAAKAREEISGLHLRLKLSKRKRRSEERKK